MAGEWWREGVFYEIYARSFRDSNGDGIGDLAGLIERLDHLKGKPDSLGVDAIWLTPIQPSPMHDFGYDVSNYRNIDPRFGSLADFDRLLEEAHRRDLRVILDLVPNHTSHEHPWFRESRQDRTNAKRSWYVWRDPAADGGPPNNWVSSFGGPAWTLDPATGQYYLHSFLAEQPDLNYRNPEVVQAMEDVIRFWLDRGVDGFRVDVIHKMVKDEALRDNPLPAPEEENPVVHYGGQIHLHDEDQPEVHEIIRSWRRILDEYGDRTMVGEVYLFDPERLATYYGNGEDELPLAFNFRFLWSPWDAAVIREQVDRIESLVPPGAQPTWVLSSHDAPRHRTRFDHPEHGAARARAAALLLLTLRGTPFLYYGEEIGMRDGVIPEDRICDPVGKRFVGLGRDPERTPMAWDASPRAGFTDGPEPWLPLSDGWQQGENVAAQTEDPLSLFDLYRRLLRLRQSHEALRRGAYEAHDSAEGMFVYDRVWPGERLRIAINFADRPQSLSGLPPDSRPLLSTDPTREFVLQGSELELAPAEGILLVLPA